MPSVVIFALIYRSVRYLDFLVEQLTRFSDGFDCVIVGNDPTPEVEQRLADTGMPYLIHHSRQPDAYHINRVYECVNWANRTIAADYLIETQSDMALSPGWAAALVEACDGSTLPVSRLVHPFTIGEGGPLHPVADFGTPGSLRGDDWLRYAQSIRTSDTLEGGLYAPRIMDREWFLSSGGFPEGNLDHKGQIAAGPGEYAHSGDAWFYKHSGKRHVTVCGSVVYHLQEGEMLDK